MIPDERVAEVVSRLTGVPTDELKYGIPPELPVLDSADSLDTIELVMELEEEFDNETVRWAFRYVEALAARSRKRRNSLRPEKTDPLWDWDLDGRGGEKRDCGENHQR
jgi:hypothetical protein